MILQGRSSRTFLLVIALLLSTIFFNPQTLYAEFGANLLSSFQPEEMDEVIEALTFDPKGDYLATGGGDGVVRLWNYKKGELKNSLTPDVGYVRSIEIPESSKMIAAAGMDKTIKSWKPSGGEPTSVLEGHEAGIVAMGISPSEEWLATAGGDNQVIVWDRRNNKIETTLSILPLAEFNDVEFSPDGKWLAATFRMIESGGGATIPSGVIIWKEGKWKDAFRFGSNDASKFTFHPEGKNVATTELTEIVLRNMKSGEVSKRFVGHEGYVNTVAFNSTGSLMMSGDDDGFIKFWDTNSAESLATIEKHDDSILVVTISADGKFAASGDESGQVHVWKLNDVPSKKKK